MYFLKCILHFCCPKRCFVDPKIWQNAGSAPDPAGGAYDAPLDPLVGWGGDTPLQTPPPLSAFGARYSAFPLLLIYEMTTAWNMML